MKILSFFLLGQLLLFSASIEQLFNIQTIKIKKVSSTPKTHFWGVVAIDQTRAVEIAPRYSGFVTDLYADRIYMKVTKNRPLARIYSPELFRAKEEYLNAITYAKKRGDRAMVESARRKLRLYGVSPQEIQRCLKKRSTCEESFITAPASGYLFKKRIEKGSAFKTGQTLFRIVDLTSVWVEVKIPETQLSQALKAHRIVVLPKSGTRSFVATHPTLYPAIDPKEGLLTLRVVVKNPTPLVAPLFPGMLTHVTFKGAQKSYLVVPRTAIIHKMGRWYLFKKGEFEGEYEPTEVSVKPLDNNTYAILSGAKEGEEVAANALFLLDSDAQINGLW